MMRWSVGHDVHRARLVDWRAVTVEDAIPQNEWQVVDAVVAIKRIASA